MIDRVRLGRWLAPALLTVVLAVRGFAVSEAPLDLVGGTPKTLTAATLAAALGTETKGRVSPDRKTLTFSRRVVRLVATTGPDSDMLSYRVDGLRNPTLVVPMGATLRVLFVNTDDDMTHNLRFTVRKPPFKGAVNSAGTTNLPHKSQTAYHAEDLTARVPAHAGTYAYLCTVPGHAPGGMYGTLIVR